MHFLNLNESVNVGGHRILINDLYQLQTANEELGQVFAESFGSTGSAGRILAGAIYTTVGSPTPTSVSYSAGWMIFNGKIYKINALPSTPYILGAIIWLEFKTENTYPPVTYQSGAIYQVHQHHEVNVTYSVTPPSGTIFIDYVPAISVSQRRISDIITQADASTTAITDYNATWTLLDQSYVQTNLLHSGITSVASGTFIKYKKIGSSLFLNVNIVLSSPAPQNFSLKFPVALSPLIASNNPLIFATDTKAINEPAWVSFSKEVITPSPIPALMVFLRNHADTTLHAVSFSTVLEITT